MGLITLKEYAERHGRQPDSVRQKALRDGFTTARRIGRDWFIDEDEEYVDNRVKHGKFVGIRNKDKE